MPDPVIVKFREHLHGKTIERAAGRNDSDELLLRFTDGSVAKLVALQVGPDNTTLTLEEYPSDYDLCVLGCITEDERLARQGARFKAQMDENAQRELRELARLQAKYQAPKETP